MLGKFFTTSTLVLALCAQVYGHAAIAPALGVGNGGTPNRGDVKNPNNGNPCGNGVNIGSSIDSSTAVTIKDGSITVKSINFNGGGDGSRQVSAKLDATGKGDTFNTDLTVTKNGDPSPNEDQGEDDVVVTIPADTKCTGGKDGNKCLVQFTTTAGFGNCVVAQQDAPAPAPAAADPTPAAGNANADAGAGADANAANDGAAGNADAKAADKVAGGAADTKTADKAAGGAADDKEADKAAGGSTDANADANAANNADANAANNADANAANNTDANAANGAAAADAGANNAGADANAGADNVVAPDANAGGNADVATTGAGAAAGATGAAANAGGNGNANGMKKKKKNRKNRKGSRPVGTRAARAVLAGIDVRTYEAPEILRRSWSWAKDLN